ncbi:MAG TPA: family 10 glycosylhydrolase [Ignavibacteriaceae bacterium]|nr:family 10 glycosylhydrolase [Ignavibacteriaceae bacterium]
MKKYFIVLFVFLLTSLTISFSQKVNSESITEGVRGVWLTNVDSEVLNSREKISEAVELCERLGLNVIFVVTYNKGMTLYPSKVMKNLFDIEIDSAFIGRDPLQEVIEEAHKRNIKVFAWFEFGFSTSYQLDGGHILKKKPEWASKKSDGYLVVKNGFDWMNAFHPEAQNFMLSLIEEVVTNYNVDGIQGDDRLPAMPSEGGYDDFTVSLYKKSHEGKNPPTNFKDEDWVQWRADILTNFLEKLYSRVKAINNNVIVSMSPSIYPWSKEEYLQDWPEWLRRGIVELVCPQVYRYDLSKYQSALTDIVKEQVPTQDLWRIYPGVLIKVGSYYSSEKYLNEMIEYNRENGLNGEVFFFYEGLKKHIQYLENNYNQGKVKFPEFNNYK